MSDDKPDNENDEIFLAGYMFQVSPDKKKITLEVDSLNGFDGKSYKATLLGFIEAFGSDFDNLIDDNTLHQLYH